MTFTQLTGGTTAELQLRLPNIQMVFKSNQHSRYKQNEKYGMET